jgi:hypothetical protein
MRPLMCPALVIVLPLEGSSELRLLAHNYEDERALRAWLRSSRVLEDLPDAVLALLDFLDDLDWPEAA